MEYSITLYISGNLRILKRQILAYTYLIKHLQKSWGIDTGILNFDTRWKCMSVLVTLLQEVLPRNLLDMVLGRPHTQSGRYSKEKNIFPCRLPNHDSSDVQHVKASLQRLTEVSWFPLCKVGHFVPKLQYSTSIPYLFLRSSASQESFFRFSARLPASNHPYRSASNPPSIAGIFQKYFTYNWKCKLQ